MTYSEHELEFTFAKNLLSHRTATTTKFSTGNELPDTNGAKLLTIQSGRPGLHLASIHQRAPLCAR